MKNKELVPNASIFIESIRSLGYSFEAAISDIIDNSVGKGARRVDIKFDYIDEPYVAIIDDGCGMTGEELEVAMQYGSQSSLNSRDMNDLGRFGLGMKTASLSQCRKVTVISKRNNEINAARWDIDNIILTNGWNVLIFEKEDIAKIPIYKELEKKESGTIVLWENFDRLKESTDNFEKSINNKIQEAENHISLVFHKFMQESNLQKRVKFYINNEEIQPHDPFYLDNPATQILPENTITFNESVIKVKAFIIPHFNKLKIKDRELEGRIRDFKNSQGFYIYRNKRLIVWGKWFGLARRAELNKLARIMVDIPNTLDSMWEIDIKKSSASLPDTLKRHLVNAVEKSIDKSEHVYRYRGKNINNDEYMNVWNEIDDRGLMRLEINKDMQLIREIQDGLDGRMKGYFAALLKIIETSVPFHSIYFKMANNKINLENYNKSDEKIYTVVKSLVQAGIDQGIEKEELFTETQIMFKNKIDEEIIDRIRGELSDE